MGFHSKQAWVTSVLDEDSVPNALVLAKSLRQSKTTRQIVAIISNHVGNESRRLLNKFFDIILWLDGELIPGKLDVSHAKAFTFSLVMFQKCVFVSANSMILENVDFLFENNDQIQIRPNFENTGTSDLSVFVVEPDTQLWNNFCESLNHVKVSEEYLGTWLCNQQTALETGHIPKQLIADICLGSGKLVGESIHAPIIHFTAGLKPENLYEQLHLLRAKELGLAEMRIMDAWLETFELTKSTDPVFRTITQPSYKNEPIAIVGMSCRYPGANNLQEFWNLLYAGEEAIRPAPPFRWTKEHTVRGTVDERKQHAGFLSTKVDEFDARFFGMSPKEAAYLDPQARLLHEVLWESLEDAGIDPMSLRGTHTGVFTGSWMNDYKDIVCYSADNDFFRSYMGNGMGASAARLSFLLGLTGPSIATESGCSSAIVALDLAVKSLRAMETNLALAGGVNLLLHPFNNDMMDFVISSDGRCKTFDEKANGFGRAEGCGVLVLKRLSDALRDRDNIWSLIRGSAVSQEGLSTSLGTPTVHAEALAMKLAMKDANVHPELVTFVETHGTGTQVGDPMEVAAIAKAYHSPKRIKPLIIGSVKTNVGHTESCSGITGIMKAVLAMQREIIPRHRNLETLNKEIFLESIPAVIPIENTPWPKVNGQPRICGVSSFGITGTDGHVILEEAPADDLPKFNLGMERPLHLMTISAKTDVALDELLNEYAKRFTENGYSDHEFASVAYSANVGRAHFNYRTFIKASSCQGAKEMLKGNGVAQSELREGHIPRICFLFTGQGSQYQGMAKALYDSSPIFRAHFDVCDRELRNKYDISIKQVLWESEDSRSKELNRTIYSQTSIFCVEYCLLKLWQSWGIHPDYVVGHSLGEFCAAVATGILNFENALQLVAERSRLIDSLPRGSMVVIKANKSDVEKFLHDSESNLDFAAINSPEQTVVAGDNLEVQKLLSYLKARNVKAIILEASHAFHSRHMDPILEMYRTTANTITFKQGNPNIQYISGMEGRIIEDASELGADYWVRHTREKVSFVDACAVLREMGCEDFLEVGPQPVLSTFILMNNEGNSLNCLPSLRKGQSDWETMLNSLGKLFLLGYPIDWKAYDEPYKRKKVSLPFHPFHRQPFWIHDIITKPTSIHPLIGHAIRNASALHIFQNDLTLKAVPYLKDHCIGNLVVFPGAGFTEMCLSAGYCVANAITENFEQPTRGMQLTNLNISAPLELKKSAHVRLQVIVDLPEEASHGFRVKIFHQHTSKTASEKWVLHASAVYGTAVTSTTNDCISRWDPSRIRAVILEGEPILSNLFYKMVDDQGLKFGESFRMIQRFWRRQEQNHKHPEVVAEIRLPADCNRYILHPLIIDAAFQTGILTDYRPENMELSRLKVPVRVGQVILLTPLMVAGCKKNVYLHARHDEKGHCSVFVSTADWTPVALVEGVELMETNVRTIESVLQLQSKEIPDSWEEQWKVISPPFKSSLQVPVDIEPFFRNYVPRKTEEHVRQLYSKTDRLIYLYTVRALVDLGWQPQLGELITADSLSSKLGIKVGYLRQQVHFYLSQLEKRGSFLEAMEEGGGWRVVGHIPKRIVLHEESEIIVKQLKSEPLVRPTTLIYEHIAGKLKEILQDKESALSLLFPEEDKQQFSADAYYQNHPNRQENVDTISKIVHTVIEKSKELNTEQSGGVFRVLEVGAGTGSMSQAVLSLLRDKWESCFEYYYTDVSKGFFVKAEKRFEEFRENIKFEVFDVEKSPLSQGIPVDYFDMVCCTDVLHATRNLEESLVHLRQTLKPGGILFFTETVLAAFDITFLFGLLQGYWRFEDFQLRPDHCCVSVQVWQVLLKKSGFRGINSITSYLGQFAYITAMADETCQVERLKKPTCMTKTDNIQQKKWTVFSDKKNLQVFAPVTNLLQASGFQVELVMQEENLGSDDEKANEVSMSEKLNDSYSLAGVIFAWGMNSRERDQRKMALPLLNLAKCVMSKKYPPQLFVLTKGVHAVQQDTDIKNPSPATLFGMIKSLKNEAGNLFARYVDLDGNSTPQQLAKQVLYELARSKTPREEKRVQVAYRDGMRYEPRMVKGVLPSAGDTLKLPVATDRFKLKLPASRVIQNLEFEPLLEQAPRENEVEVKVRVFALNFRDILTILKPITDFENFNTVGLDFSGVVLRAGKASGYKPGDRVFGANFKKDEQLPSHLVLEAERLFLVPDDMTFAEAATLPAVFLTTFHCLISLAKMKQGDTVLIHTGSGGVGLAVIQLAKLVGAKIICTAGSPRKKAYLRSLAIEHVFHSRDTSFEQDILRVTDGRGVDIVLNSITGPGIKEATLGCSAHGARFVEMSKLNVWTHEEVRSRRPDVQYHLVDLTMLDKETFDGLYKQMREHLLEGHLKPIPSVRFDALYIRQALHHLQKARHIGKVVVAMPNVKTEKGQYKTEIPLFNRESTYLITGGLGGIGFAVCKWMLGLGATNIVLMGRNEPKINVAEKIMHLNEEGANVIVKLGDVSNFDQCRTLIDEIKMHMKPLRGVMHCAGILRDNMYANQTWADFDATYKPKVEGTWNLHKLTKGCALEHFVVYSSVAALLGTPAQANHSSANCFEDSFIHYRHSRGLPGTSISWGQWAEVGVARDVALTGGLLVSAQRMLNGLQLVLTAQKRQVSFCEFDSFNTLSRICPIVRHYLDEGLWRQYSNEQTTHNVMSTDQFWREMDAAVSPEEKKTVVSTCLKALLRASLHMDPDHPISETQVLAEMGVDSLIMVELKNSLQVLFGNRVTITASMLVNCNRMCDLATSLVNVAMQDTEMEEKQSALPLSDAELAALLKNDSILDKNVKVTPGAIPASKSADIRTILVTGAAGQLAPYLITEIAKTYSAVEKIWCLVQGENQKVVEQKLKMALQGLTVDMKKVEALLGDVTLEKLGLPTEIYDDLVKSVDAVLHCAASTHPTEDIGVASMNRTDIRSVNIEGTVHILRFACSEKVKRVYYPSSIVQGIFDEKMEGSLADTWPEASVIETIMRNKPPGIQSTRWICELLLRQANERGIPCKVFRLSWLGGDSKTGRVDPLKNLYILRYLHFLRLGAMSDMVIPANVLPVDLLAELALYLFMKDETPNEIFNIAHPQPNLEQEFLRVAEQTFGTSLEVLGTEAFAEKIKQQEKCVEGENQEVVNYQKYLSTNATAGVNVITGYLSSSDTFFRNEKVCKYIVNYGENFPSTMDVIQNTLLYLKHKGCLNKLCP